ncbi:MAG: beta-ketoacyl-ACP synthase II [Anaerolineae bacterium]
MAISTRKRDNAQRVVVTGLGAITPVGLSVSESWQALVEGRSGIRRITRFDVSSYPTQIAGTVESFDPSNYMDRKQAKRMSRFSQFAVAAAQEALSDAGLDLAQEDPLRCGVLLGCVIGAMDDVEGAVRTLVAKGGKRLSPFISVMIPPNVPAFQVALTYGLKGYNNTVATACAASTQAIGEAAEVIRRGQADVIVAGGTESNLCEATIALYCASKALATRNDEPERASRPFDKDRDGFVPSEGSGILVLESLAHARQRDARIYCEVLGYGATSDAYHLIAPDPTGAGAANAMRVALTQAGIDPSDVDYINAHGPGTPLGDATETIAIKRMFGTHAYQVAISSIKSMIGHLAGAAGAVEGIATIKAIETGVIPPTINLDTPDPECDLDYVPLIARRARVDVAMSNNFGQGGQNVSVIFGCYSS